jgi:hypothetical protein
MRKRRNLVYTYHKFYSHRKASKNLTNIRQRMRGSDPEFSETEREMQTTEQ